MITAVNAKHRITRNSSHFKKIHQTPSNEVSADDYNDDDYRDMPNNVRQPGVNEQHRYPLRANRGQPPERFNAT